MLINLLIGSGILEGQWMKRDDSKRLRLTGRTQTTRRTKTKKKSTTGRYSKDRVEEG